MALEADGGSPARLTAIVETSDDAIVSKSPDGIIQSWKATAGRIFGYSTAEAIGQSRVAALHNVHSSNIYLSDKLRAMLDDSA